jgi:4-hydroxy-tetrahydrodipicolinate synthase
MTQALKQKLDKLRGVYPVFQTPFHDDETIDAATLEKEIAWMYDQGVHGIVMAMVSETLRLSSEEREQLASLACRFGQKRGGVVISVGAESTRVAERYAKHAESVGAVALMAIPPVSVAVATDELLRYYDRLIRAVSIPVVVQDASGYVGRPMPVAMQASLLDKFGDQVMYKPEASPIGPNLTALREATGGRARVFEGTGGIALVDSHRRGIIGTMPGADMCWALVDLWNALEAGDEQRVNAINGPLCSMISMQSSLDAFLAVEKHLLVKQGVFRNTLVRGPVGFRLDDETRREIDRLFDLLRQVTGK